MKSKAGEIILKILLSLILIMPILGLTGVFPPPTRDLYNTDLAFAFIQMLTSAQYILIMMAVVHIIALWALWTRREALAAILILPITLNVVGFHMMLDGGLMTGGATMGNVMLLLNLYFIWKYRNAYRELLLPRVM